MVNIQPTAGTYGLFKNYNYQPWTAIAELVDNSISSWVTNRDKFLDNELLKVEIEFNNFGGGQLLIRDNAAGIDEDAFFNRAFALAKPPPDLSSISRFGVGMKAAACWFADNWLVSTTALGESVERTLEWDTAEIIASEITDLAPTTIEVSPSKHFTEIKMWNLHHPISSPATAKKVKTHLGKMFRRFISSGEIEIYFNGERLIAETYEPLFAPYFRSTSEPETEWHMPIEMELESGQIVTGRALVLSTMTKQKTGLNYFWHGRLIRGNFDPQYRPAELFGAPNSFRTGRLYIELDMDDFTPTIDKQNIAFDSSGTNEEDLIQALRKYIDKDSFPLLRQAENYRSKEPDVRSEVLVKVLDAVSKEISFSASDVLATPVDHLPEAPYSPRDQKEISETAQELKLVIDGETWQINITYGNAATDTAFVKIYENSVLDQEATWSLDLLIGLRNPFNVQYFNQETAPIITRLAAALAFGELMAKGAGAKYPSYVRNNFDRFLSFVLSQGS
jgi:hypothetical protein